MGQDLRYAIRLLRKSPGFAAVTIAILAVGIGVNALIFTAIDAILLRQAAIADPQHVVSVLGTASYPNYLDIRESGVFEDVAAFSSVAVAFDDGRQTDLIPAEIVSGNYFALLGVSPAIGRAFLDDEDRRGAPVRVTVLSHAFWRARFVADAGIVGQSIRLNGSAYTVIGIAPAAFTNLLPGPPPSIWLPMATQQEIRPPSANLRRRMGSTDLLSSRGSGWLSMVARSRAGSTPGQLASSLTMVAERLRAYPDVNRDVQLTAVPLGEGPGVRASARPMLRLLAAAAGLVLLIVCANVGGLLLARDASRRREFALRMSIGASVGRLARQALAESTLIALLAGGAGLLVARWGIPLLHQVGVPESVDLKLGVGVVGFTFAVALLSGAATGLATVVQTVRRDPAQALRDETGSVVTGARAVKARSALVVVQVGVSLVLLVAAGLFLRTLQNAYGVDLGYSLDNVMLVDVNLDVSGYSDSAGPEASHRILDRVAALPGVQIVGAARSGVLSGSNRTVPVSTDGQPVNDANRLVARVNVVNDQYFTALGIPLLRGRTFTAIDTASSPPVAVVTRGLADRLWPQSEPVGRLLMTATGPVEVVGVVANNVYVRATESAPPPVFYLALSQNYEALLTLHVRTATANPMSAAAGVRQAIREIDPRIVVTRPRTLVDEFERSIANQRLMATMIGLFGALALLLTAMGLYGVMAYAVGQRTREIGVRMALGADRAAVVGMVARQGAWLVLIGTGLGIGAAIPATRLIRSQLFGVSGADPMSYALALIVLLAVGALGCVLPARRAARVDPLVALRTY